MKILKPKKIKIGDTIGIVAPSKFINPLRKKHLEIAKKYFISQGFKVVYGKNLFKIDRYAISAGTAKERAADINQMFGNKNINAIWCFQGGGTAIELLDKLDYELIKKNPKIFLGKSDVDILLLAIQARTGLITFHAPDFRIGRGIDMDFDYSKEWFIRRIMNGEKEIKKSTPWKVLRKGNAQGRILGCNETALAMLTDTKYQPKINDVILFLEDFNTQPKYIIKRLKRLELSGFFKNIRGLVIGYAYGYQDKEMKKNEPKLDKFGKQIKFENLVTDFLKNYKFPIIKINEFGHYNVNAIIPIGAKVEIKNEKINIIEDFLS